MSDEASLRSDFYGALDGIDFCKLAERFDAPVERVRDVLTRVAEALDLAVLVVRPAGNKQLVSVATKISKLRASLAHPAVDTRLVIASLNEERQLEGNEKEDLQTEEYISARSRVDEALEALRDLEHIVTAAANMALPPGQPSYEEWYEAGVTLKNFWVNELGRDATISGHGDDGRDVKTSAFVQFVTECLRQLGASVDEQGCRTFLIKLRAMDWDTRGHRPYGIT